MKAFEKIKALPNYTIIETGGTNYSNITENLADLGGLLGYGVVYDSSIPELKKGAIVICDFAEIKKQFDTEALTEDQFGFRRKYYAKVSNSEILGILNNK